MSADHVSTADRCRAALKAAGYNARKVTAACAGGLDSTLIVTVRDRDVMLDDVRAIADTFRAVAHDAVGDILAGGNVYVRVRYARGLPFTTDAWLGRLDLLDHDTATADEIRAYWPCIKDRPTALQARVMAAIEAECSAVRS